MYLSKDKNNNTILTLWLDNNVQEAWADRSNTEGYGYGYANGGLYSSWAAGSGYTNTTATSEFPCNMYGASYVNAVTLNNGGVYSTSIVNTAIAQQSKDSAFALFTMPQFGLTDYIVTPRDVSWQEEQSAKDILNADYRANNDAWATGMEDSDYPCYDSEEGFYWNYSNKEYYAQWADSYIWLPSVSELGYKVPYSGLWNVSVSQRANGIQGESSAITFRGSVGAEGISNNAKNVIHTRSGGGIFYTQCKNPISLYASGNEGLYNVVAAGGYAFAIRPALHLNLSQIDAHFSATDISSGEITVTPENDTYNGSAKNPIVTVKYNGATLVNGVDYIVRKYIDGVQVDEIKTAGIYTLKAVGKLNYTGNLSTTFIVQGGALGSTIISPPNECVVFKRSSGGPNLYLNDTSDGGNYRLIQGVDYTIESRTIDYTALTGSITIIGKGNYSGGIVIKTYTLVLLDPKAGMYMAIYD